MNSVWYRAVLNPFAATAFSYAHTKAAQSRFNAGSYLAPADQFATFYLAGDAITALFEVGAMLGTNRPGASVSNPNVAHTMYNVQVMLQKVFDLSNPNAQLALDTTAQELTGDWHGNSLRSNRTRVKTPTGEAPTQALGREIYKNSNAEGFIAISAKVPYDSTLVVFPDKLMPGSSLVYTDPNTGNIEFQIP